MSALPRCLNKGAVAACWQMRVVHAKRSPQHGRVTQPTATNVMGPHKCHADSGDSAQRAYHAIRDGEMMRATALSRRDVAAGQPRRVSFNAPLCADAVAG
jgi:hypothetical protein